MINVEKMFLIGIVLVGIGLGIDYGIGTACFVSGSLLGIGAFWRAVAEL